MTPRRVRIALVLAGLSLLVPASVRGQFDSGQIAGFVRDTSGAVISGATVLAMNEGNRDERRAAEEMV